ncbi:hypothetical protein ABIB62_000008 [Mucilaginibacter sp. UYP25]|uniref:dsDNA nuclease domain-containing protein n=1 Tax=unclassified Mucilaginibacter TaxID=2617802 RepID=UPI00339B5348
MSKSVNAGVHNAIGIEFQKHCALFLLFNNYSTLKGGKYFICIEHHDDVLFCHQGVLDELTSIDSYQVKKTSEKWGLTKDFIDIISKIAGTGIELENDLMPKSSTYKHNLQFTTNHAINLLIKQKKPLPNISELINESNSLMFITGLHQKLNDKIAAEIEEYWKPDKAPLAQIKNISLAYIDLPKKSQPTIDQLVGLFKRAVNPDIIDASAAVHTLIKLFREVENTLNNGNISKLMDTSKRVTSEQITKVINIINTRQKAYNFWRDEGKDLAKKLNITIADQMGFEKLIEDSFDFFKDLKQAEHRKILNFVKSNIALLHTTVDEVECINELYNKFLTGHNTPLSDKLLKSALVAAYIETRGTL